MYILNYAAMYRSIVNAVMLISIDTTTMDIALLVFCFLPKYGIICALSQTFIRIKI